MTLRAVRVWPWVRVQGREQRLRSLSPWPDRFGNTETYLATPYPLSDTIKSIHLSIKGSQKFMMCLTSLSRHGYARVERRSRALSRLPH